MPKAQEEHIEDSQRNITSCRNEVGTLGTKDEEVTAEMDKGIMVADSFRSEQECWAELALVWKGLRADVKKFCESCKECQLTRSVRIKDRSSSTPVARPEFPFEHTRWGEAVPLTSLSAKVTCEAWLNIFSRTEIYLLSKGEGFVEKNSAASWVTVLDLWKWYFGRSLTKVLLKTRHVGQRCTFNLSRAETSSRWCGEVVGRGVCLFRCRPRHLTMVQNYVIRREKLSCR
ncbi:uncharacterized protein TNCV_1916421 [Trichonephila clavipes]|uniref:Integrase zinc-binding domain-containing protein n=1 Tax=Trichonephila clavipes TaxID=2585209 RepID=A0A8X7BCX8_TRICX|nr:uncharacterized protein TNCV_1916421 [Trichonephila clavipes]